MCGAITKFVEYPAKVFTKDKPGSQTWRTTRLLSFLKQSRLIKETQAALGKFGICKVSDPSLVQFLQKSRPRGLAVPPAILKPRENKTETSEFFPAYPQKLPLSYFCSPGMTSGILDACRKKVLFLPSAL